MTTRQQRRVASLSADLTAPTFAADDAAFVAHVGSSRIALPSGTRIASGAQGIVYVLISGELHILVESAGRVRELVVDDRLSAQIKAEAFGA